MMPRVLALIVLGALLSGCAEYTAASSAVRSEGKLVAAEALDANLWYLCRATPIGVAITRFNGKWDAYAKVCQGFWDADGPPTPLVPKP